MEEREYFLNRTLITGFLDLKTPICVLKEILAAHGGKIVGTGSTDPFRESLFLRDKIREIRPITLKIMDNNFTPEDYNLVARFVNPNVREWSIPQLMTSFKHLWSFTGKISLNSEIVVGEKSPAQLNAYNACMLFAICKHYNLRASLTTTIEEMGSIVTLFLSETNVIRSQTLDLLSTMSKSELINIITMTRKDRGYSTSVIRHVSPSSSDTVFFPKLENVPELAKITNDSLESAYDIFSDETRLLSRVVARDNSEAVIIGAIVYGFNFYNVKNPLRELHSLENVSGLGATETGGYIPVDKDFRELYLRNPKWYNIKENWSPNIPRVYSEKTLRELAAKEGYLDHEITLNGASNLLYFSRTTPNFYSGKHPSLPKEATTAISLEDINELENDIVVSYGIDVAVSGSKMVFHRLKDLCSQFKHDRNFTNPEVPTEVFSTITIKKLVLIIEKNILYRDKDHIYDENIELLITIKGILLWRQNCDCSKNFQIVYRQESPENKLLIIQYMKLVFEISMYMRGWKISSEDYPILSEQCRTTKQDQVETKTIESLQQFELFSQKVPNKLRIQLQNLKLMKIQKSADGSIFTPVVDDSEGLTIIGRINIVRKNESVKSCIRLTSNILAPTSYYYLFSINEAPLVDISNIEIIG
jgi:hypothetical protein